MNGALSVAAVIPTIGRASLGALLRSLADSEGPPLASIVLADDRPSGDGPLLQEPPPPALADRLRVVRSGGRGPAGARNAGWRAARARWIAFLDDDVLVPRTWLQDLHDDLVSLPADVAGSQARIHVPLPTDRAPTDWERNVAGLERARWATADLAYRRDVLVAIGGFDERFPRAYREDADLGLRITGRGWRIVRGARAIIHPVRPTDDRVSIRLQAGNADDPFMWALHGRDWRQRAGVGRGRRRQHLLTTAAALTGLAGVLGRRPTVAALGASLWAGSTASFAWRRIAPGPRTGDEVRRMLATSVVLPFAATWHWLAGIAALARKVARSGPRPGPPAAVLFDRDGTLVHDVPYNGDPDRVQPVDGAVEVLARLRQLGLPIGIVSNQSGIGRGLLTEDQVDAVDRCIERLLGPFDVWLRCPHVPDDGCGCRKPEPGMVVAAAEALGVDVRDVVVIGDIGADVAAAGAAGARGILVPTAATLSDEVAAAQEVAADLHDAVALALGERGSSGPGDGNLSGGGGPLMGLAGAASGLGDRT